MKNNRLLVLICLTALLLSGCQTETHNEPEAETDSGFVSMEESPDLSYDVPESLPRILVNQLGYYPSGVKTVIFCGVENPDSFNIINADTGQVAYSGVPEFRGYDETYEREFSYADFSELTVPGEYYVEAPLLGRSYSFVIEDNLYDKVFHESIKQYYYNRCGITLTENYAGNKTHNACHTGKAVLRKDMNVALDVSGGWHENSQGSKKIETAAKNVATMLLAFELFEDSFTDDINIPESGNGIPDLLDEIRYEIDWFLKMQDPETGAVYDALTISETNNKGINAYVENESLEASRAFAMAVAKFSYLYQNYDLEYSTVCLKAADRAWQYALLNENQDESTVSDWKLAAGAELYRASGDKSCKKILEEAFLSEKYESANHIRYFAYITYLSTKQDVEIAFCTQIMDALMDKAGKIAQESKKGLLYVNSNAEQSNNSELTENMIYLSIVNHIISNQEYETVIENHLHYLMGRNVMSLCYLDDIGYRSYAQVYEGLGLMKQFDENSKLIFLLAEIITHHL